MYENKNTVYCLLDTLILSSLTLRSMAYRVEKLPIDRIKVQRHNVRRHDIDVGIDDLVTSIKVHGLLEPIVAYKSNETYYILTGQRRLNAYVKLNEDFPGEGYDSIPCFVRDEPESDNQKKALSLAENITQLPMTEVDLVKAVTDLYNEYGNYELVQEKFGLSKYMVNKYVKQSRLPVELNAAIERGEIASKPKVAINMAIKAVDAYNYTTGCDTPIDTVIELTKALVKGTVDPEDAKKGAQTGKTVREMEEMKDDKKQLRLAISTEMDEKLDKVAQFKESPKVAVATEYVNTGVDRDYRQVEQG